MTKLGNRDLRELNIEPTNDGIAGAAVDYLNHMEIDDNDKYAVTEAMGVPTDVLPDGTNIGVLQRAPRGERYYHGKLGMPAGKKTAVPPPSTQNAVIHQNRLPATPVDRKGMDPKRTRKKLRRMALEGTPNTSALAEEALNDLATGTKNAATEAVRDAAEESDIEECSEDIAVMVCKLKMKEHERKKRDSI